MAEGVLYAFLWVSSITVVELVHCSPSERISHAVWWISRVSLAALIAVGIIAFMGNFVAIRGDYDTPNPVTFAVVFITNVNLIVFHLLEARVATGSWTRHIDRQVPTLLFSIFALTTTYFAIRLG